MVVKRGVNDAHLVEMAAEQGDFLELLQGQQARTQSVIDIVIVVGNFVGEICELCFERRSQPLDEAFSDFAKPPRILERAMFQDAFAGFEAQIEAIERRVALLENVDHAQGLQVMFEAAMDAHAVMQRILPGVSEWRVSQVMGQRDRLDQIFIEIEIARDRARDLGGEGERRCGVARGGRR